MTEKTKTVGKSIPKIDSYALLTGKPKFTDDIDMRGMLICKILTSPHPHARIKSIDISKAEKLPGVRCVLCHKNVTRKAHTTAGQGYPEPSPYDAFIFDSKVRYVGDRVAAVAADDLETAEKALGLIKVEYELLKPVFDPERSMDKGAPVIHDEKEAHVIIPVEYKPEKNLAAHVDMVVGDLDKGFAEADYVVENKYSNHYGQHCPIEPHIVITYFDENGRLVVRTSTQVPFHVRRILSYALDYPLKNIRVIKPRIGGGFGAKQEVLIEEVAALMTIKTGKSCLKTSERWPLTFSTKRK